MVHPRLGGNGQPAHLGPAPPVLPLLPVDRLDGEQRQLPQGRGPLPFHLLPQAPAAHRHQPLPVEQVMQIARPLGGDGDKAVRHPVGELRVFRHHLQAEIQLGMELAQPRQARDQPLHGEGAVDREPHPHLAAAAQLLAALGYLAEPGGDPLEVDLSLGRQRQQPALAQQQPLPQKILQQADLVAHRALADVELQGGAGEAQQAGNHLEILHRTEGRQLHYPKFSCMVIFYHFTG